jgi:hypothetical protein
MWHGWGRGEVHTGFWWGSLRERDHLEVLGVDTWIITPWSRVLPEKLTVPQLGKKYPAFHGTRRFITAFTSALHVSLS